MNVQGLAEEISHRIDALEDRSVDEIRSVRREYSTRLKDAPAEDVLAVAHALVGRHRWVAYELVAAHPRGFSVLDDEEVTRLGHGIDSWGSVDAFGRQISGPAWQRGRISTELVRGWAASADRWWRRAALVSTVPLNLRVAGGTGDRDRTLDICRRLVADRDDMVVKALSWALRALETWDADAVRAFLDEYDDVLHSRVKREVRTKLETGLKTRPRPAR